MFRPRKVRDVSLPSTRIRMLFDLQLLSIHQHLSTILPKLKGTVLDVGGGESPWKSLLKNRVRYTMIDVPSGFEMNHRECAFFDGQDFPIRSDSCDAVMSIEVVEHVPDLHSHLAEVFRVLKPGGSLVATTPWSARLHYEPYDFHRFSPHSLRLQLHQAGFSNCTIQPRGHFFSVIANKTLVKLLSKPSEFTGVSLLKFLISKVFLGLCLFPILIVTHPLALLFQWIHLDQEEDPLGWTILAKKPCQQDLDMHQRVEF